MRGGPPGPGGNTPTGVGKTFNSASRALRAEKHPHGRGEDLARGHLQAPYGETPPRGVGKTPLVNTINLRKRKHPHGRGEDSDILKNSKAPVETPPRAWGRLRRSTSDKAKSGNTPTGVGKTRCTRGTSRRRWKHPHGRGEDADQGRCGGGVPETPPRAWGRPGLSRLPVSWLRNTPTGVGKT